MELATPEELGAEIRERRVQRRWTQGDLAARAGVSRQWLSRLEAGHTGAEIGRILSVARALDVALTLGERAPEVPGTVDLDELFQDGRGA